MKGMAIGTIIPWSGGIGNIPKGWISCALSSVRVSDYPLLFDIIGYQYGSSADGKSFSLPPSGNRTLSDITQNYLSNVSSTYVDYVGENNLNIDRPNFASLIDIRLNINNQISATEAYIGRITGLNLIGPFVNDNATIADRAVSELHMASHPHDGNYSSIQRAGGSMEECQGIAANGFGACGTFGTSDCCENVNYYVCELNNPSPSVNTYYKTSILGGIPLGGSGSNENFTVTNVPRRVNRNYTASGDDTELISDPYNYATTINSNFVNWLGSGNQTITGHTHSAVDWKINVGSIRVQTSITTDKILPGTVQPDNSANQSICRIEADVQTPSLRVLYIIRAF